MTTSVPEITSRVPSPAIKLDDVIASSWPERLFRCINGGVALGPSRDTRFKQWKFIRPDDILFYLVKHPPVKNDKYPWHVVLLREEKLYIRLSDVGFNNDFEFLAPKSS